MFLNLNEIISLIVISVILGYIFSGFIQRPRKEFEFRKKFDWEDIKFAAMIAAPAVILHELGHKFVALFFGLNAVLKLFWEGLGLGIFLKLINAPFLIVAPAYVSISGNGTPLQEIITSFAGPFMNLLLFLISYLMLNRSKLTKNQATILYLTKQINLLLFGFNMLPIPPLDGYSVFSNLFRIIF